MSRRVRWVGRIPPKALARVCAWHRGPMTARDRRLMERGAPVTHAMCDTCRERWLADAQALAAN